MYNVHLFILLLLALCLYAIYEVMSLRPQSADYSRKLHKDFEKHFQRRGDISVANADLDKLVAIVIGPRYIPRILAYVLDATASTIKLTIYSNDASVVQVDTFLCNINTKQWWYLDQDKNSPQSGTHPSSEVTDILESILTHIPSGQVVYSVAF